MTSEAPNHTPPAFSHETQRLAHSCPYDTLSYGTNHPPIASSQRWHLWWLKYAQMNRRGDGLVNGNKSTQPFELYQILIRDNTMFSWTFALAPRNLQTQQVRLYPTAICICLTIGYPKKLHCMVYHLPTNTCHKLAHDSILRQIHTNSVQHPKCRPFILPRQ